MLTLLLLLLRSFGETVAIHDVFWPGTRTMLARSDELRTDAVVALHHVVRMQSGELVVSSMHLNAVICILPRPPVG